MSDLTILKRPFDDALVQSQATETQESKKVRTTHINSDNPFVGQIMSEQTISGRVVYYLDFTNVEDLQATCSFLNEHCQKYLELFQNVRLKNTNETRFFFTRHHPYPKFISLKINIGFKIEKDQIYPVTKKTVLEDYALFTQRIRHQLQSIASITLGDDSPLSHSSLLGLMMLPAHAFQHHLKNLRSLKIPALPAFQSFIAYLRDQKILNLQKTNENNEEVPLTQLTQTLILNLFFLYTLLPLPYKRLRLTQDHIWELLFKTNPIVLTKMMSSITALNIKKPKVITEQFALFFDRTINIPKIGFSRVNIAFLEAMNALPNDKKEHLFKRLDKLSISHKLDYITLSPDIENMIASIMRHSQHPFRHNRLSDIPFEISEEIHPDYLKRIFGNIRYLKDPRDNLVYIKLALKYANKLIKIELQSLEEDGATNLIQRSFQIFSFTEIQQILASVKILRMGSFEDRMDPLILTHILLNAKNVEVLELERPTSHFEQYIDMLENNQFNGKAKGELLKECFTFPKLRHLHLTLHPMRVETILRYCPELKDKISTDYKPERDDEDNIPLTIDPQFAYGPDTEFTDYVSDTSDDEEDSDLSSLSEEE